MPKFLAGCHYNEEEISWLSSKVSRTLRHSPREALRKTHLYSLRLPASEANNYGTCEPFKPTLRDLVGIKMT